MNNDDLFAQSETERTAANAIRIGIIAELDAENARVKVKIGELLTDWLPWLAGRAGETRKWSCPSLDEQVLVFSPFGDPAQAVVGPGIFQDSFSAPSNNENIEKIAFSDGSSVEYDSDSSTLTVNAGSGNVVVNCNNATINADSHLTLNSPLTTCNGDLTVAGAFVSQGGGK